jgi:hypothetical protein
MPTSDKPDIRKPDAVAAATGAVESSLAVMPD